MSVSRSAWVWCWWCDEGSLVLRTARGLPRCAFCGARLPRPDADSPGERGYRDPLTEPLKESVRMDDVELDDCRVEAETKKAFLVVHDDKKVWFPKSQIANADDLEKGYVGPIRVARWLASKHGW